nr:hypothetical protein [Tanacetum cinerariifolium]
YDSQDECILKSDDRYGSVVRDIVKNVFSPRRSPIGNLACLLNVADDRIGFTYEPRMLPRWRVVEDDKALYLQRIMTIDDDENAEQVNQFLKSIEGGLQTPTRGKTIDLSISRLVSYHTENPQAVYIIIALGGRDTDSPFGGYTIEIFSPDKLYKLEDGKLDQTSEFWTITIPKKKGKSVQTIAGNLLFFQERKIWKPTLWQPT